MSPIKRSGLNLLHSTTASLRANCYMNLALEEISKAIGGTLQGSGNVKVRGYSIDSRTLNAGELFFAIKGPRFDGHQFLEQAFQRGAAAAVIEKDLEPAPAKRNTIR